LSNLSELICGNVRASHTGDLARSLWHLSQTLRLLEPHLRQRKKERRSLDRLLAPFVVRSMVEVACTSLIARLDPFRILTLAKIQGQATYDVSEKVAAAFQWQGDVVTEKVKELWRTSRKTNEMTRALLGDYYDVISWQPAFLRLLDYLQQTADTGNGSWLSELLNVEPSSLVPQFRGTALKIYSTASKGVHHEFVLSISSYYDDATLDQLAEDVVRLLATMGLVMNFAESTAYGLKATRAVSYYKALQL
jgi:hypothetical protein